MPNPARTVDPEPRTAADGAIASASLPTLAAVAAIAICVAAGNWQKRPDAAKETLRAQYDAASALAPVALASLPAAADWASLKYRAVTATGEYLAIAADADRQQGRGRARGLSRRDAARVARRPHRARQSRLDRAAGVASRHCRGAAAGGRGDRARTNRDSGRRAISSWSPIRPAGRFGRTSIPRALPRPRGSPCCR